MMKVQVIQIILIFGIIAINKCESLKIDRDHEDGDAVMFDNKQFLSQLRSIEDEANPYDNILIPNIDNRHIIDPPSRPNCKPCHKLDPRGKCRKIIGCEE